MSAFRPWELADQAPIPRRAGEIIAADFTNGSKAHSASLSISRLFNGHRERIAEYAVSGKREARALCAELNAQPWNF